MKRIFFSWQSDVAPNANTRAIRSALDAAASELSVKAGQSITRDEATRDVPGAPYIPGKLAEKIQQCDIFIGDITTVSQMPDGKSLPNPNVTFELGLAVAHLGWDRIVLLFNSKVAKFSNLPFDFDRHRISTFSILEASNPTPSERKALTELMALAVGTILDQNPRRPRELEGKSDAEVKRERDLVNIRWFLRHINVDMLGLHIQEMPSKLQYYAIVMSDDLEGVVNSPSFRLYDSKLEKIFRSLFHDLKASLSFDHVYRDTNSPWIHAFGAPGPGRDFIKESRIANEIREITKSLATNLERMITTIRDNYLEIDLDELGREFARRYAKIVKDVETNQD